MARRKQDGKPNGRQPKQRSKKGLIDCEKMKALSKEVRVEIFAVLCERVASPKEISVELN